MIMIKLIIKMLCTIILKALAYGFTSFRDLTTIVESCADQYGVDTSVVSAFSRLHTFNSKLTLVDYIDYIGSTKSRHNTS